MYCAFFFCYWRLDRPNVTLNEHKVDPSVTENKGRKTLTKQTRCCVVLKCYITAFERVFLLTVKMQIFSLRLYRKWWMRCKRLQPLVWVPASFCFCVRWAMSLTCQRELFIAPVKLLAFVEIFFFCNCAEREVQLLSAVSCSVKVVVEMFQYICEWRTYSIMHLIHTSCPTNPNNPRLIMLFI